MVRGTPDPSTGILESQDSPYHENSVHSFLTYSRDCLSASSEERIKKGRILIAQYLCRSKYSDNPLNMTTDQLSQQQLPLLGEYFNSSCCYEINDFSKSSESIVNSSIHEYHTMNTGDDDMNTQNHSESECDSISDCHVRDYHNIIHTISNMFQYSTYAKGAKVAFITAIYGSYEKSCKPYTRQTIPADFICFTDNINIESNGWIVDHYPYHEHIWNHHTHTHTHPDSHNHNNENNTTTAKDSDDNNVYDWITDLEMNNTKIIIKNALNHYKNNKNPFNIAKFYKSSFYKIPFLLEKGYEAIVWMDGTIAIQNERTAEVMLNLIRKNKNLITFERVTMGGSLLEEALSSLEQDKYIDTNFNNVTQPFQDIMQQYYTYMNNGYDDTGYWRMQSPSRIDYGLWMTCFLGFNFMNTHKNNTINFLKNWYQHIVFLSTQDQMSFSYVAQVLRMNPYSLPDEGDDAEFVGTNWWNNFFSKLEHGL